MTIGLHNLKPAPGSRHKRKRVGRGNASGHGTTATRGTKGQKSRSGVSGLKRLGMKRIMLALPKLGGFRSIATRPAVVKLGDLAAAFPDGGAVTLSVLKGKGLVPHRAAAVKVIGASAIKKPLQLKDIKVSAGAKAAIEAAGGSIVWSSRAPRLRSG